MAHQHRIDFDLDIAFEDAGGLSRAWIPKAGSRSIRFVTDASRF